MTGGENAPGSWNLQTEKLSLGKPRTFDSYEPIKVDLPQLPGDGVNAKILLNNQQVWPDNGWQCPAAWRRHGSLRLRPGGRGRGHTGVSGQHEQTRQQ